MLEFILDLPLSSAAKTLMHTRHFIRRATTTTTLTTPAPERKADSLPYTLHAHCSSNNTILTLSISSRSEAVWGYLGFERTPNAGRVVAQLSSGCCGFKGARRGTLEAGTQASVAMFRLIEKVMDKTLVVAGSSNEKDKDKKCVAGRIVAACIC
jgi:ribosomal protein S11